MVSTFPPQQSPLRLVSSRRWNSALVDRLSGRLDRLLKPITTPLHLTRSAVMEMDPQWIFVPKWSHLILKAIWANGPPWSSKLQAYRTV